MSRRTGRPAGGPRSVLRPIGCLVVALVLASCSGEDLPPLPDWQGLPLSEDAEVEVFLRRWISDVAEDRSDPDRWARLGMALEANGRPSEAADCYRAALAMGGPIGMLTYRRARSELAREQHATAIDLLETAGREMPDFSPVYWRKGHAELMLGDLEAAESSFRNALERSPAEIPALLGLARTISLQGRTEEAERLVRQVLSTDPLLPPARHLLASILRRRGEVEEAIEVVRGLPEARAVRWPDPSDVALDPFRIGFGKDLERAQGMLAEGRAAEAATLLEGLWTERPEDPTLASNLGAAYLALGRFDDAVAALVPTVERRPDLFSAVMNLAAAHHEAGRFGEAAPLARRAVELRPGDARARELLGLNLLRQRDAAGWAQLRYAAAAAPDDPLVLGRIARLQEANGRWREAVETLVLLSEAKPERGDVHRALVRARERSGILEDADRALQTAEESDASRAESLPGPRDGGEVPP